MKNVLSVSRFVGLISVLITSHTGFALEGYEVTMSFLENPYTEHGGEPRDGDAVICCTSTTRRNCQSPREDTFVPARRIVVLAPGTGNMSVDIFNGPDCVDYVQTVSASYNFTEVNLWEVA